nr:hypothetical protein [Tanacetum cinerariifolium]
MAHIRSEGALIQSIDPHLSTSYTVRSEEDKMEHDIELTDPVLDLENVKTAQAKEIASLKKGVTKLEQRQSSRILGFHPFRAGTSKRHRLGTRKVSKQERKNLKSQQMFQDINDVLDEDADTKMIVEDKDDGEKGGSTAEIVSTARPDISAARLEMKSQKAKEKGVAFKDVDDSARPIRSITTLQPLLTINLKDKGKGIIQEHEPASKAALAELYDEVQAQIDADHELAVRLTHEEQETYTVEERSKLLAESFERRMKQLAKERAEAIKSKPPTKTQLRMLMMTYLKHTRSKEDEKRIGSRKKRAVVSDDDKAIDYETLDVKCLIVDCESQVLGTNEADDVHVYKLTILDGSYRHFSTFSRMLEVLDRQDVLDLHKIIMERFLANDPEGYDLIL